MALKLKGDFKISLYSSDEAKSYFLGFIYADGHITIKDRRKSGWKEYVFRINLSKNDEEILELFKKELELKCAQYRIDFIEADIHKGYKQVLAPYLAKRQKML